MLNPSLQKAEASTLNPETLRSKSFGGMTHSGRVRGGVRLDLQDPESTRARFAMGRQRGAWPRETTAEQPHRRVPSRPWRAAFNTLEIRPAKLYSLYEP